MTTTEKNKNVRVRFAPSPTGYLHVGGARTALYNWLYARASGGKFILRVEDTDQVRSTQEFLQKQMDDLKWLGLDWDEGEGVGGNYGPYKQSQRLHIYKEHADKLLAQGTAFYCFCTDQELEIKKQEAMRIGKPPQYDGICRKLSKEEVDARLAKNEKAAVRFHIANRKAEYKFKDLIRGEVTFPSDMVGDFVILRSDKMPVYNFCCVIDDALMKITHVLRAEEHLSNTVRQLMLYEAFGYEIPEFGHLSIILGPDRQKLSKRHGATSVFQYKESGFLPEAMNNFVSLLGWSSPKGDEVMTMQSMQEQFTLDRFNPAAAVFDEVKLKWMNSVHLRNLPEAELWKRVKPFLENQGLRFSHPDSWAEMCLSAFKTSMETLADAVALFKPLSDEAYQVSAEGLPVAKGSRAVIEMWRDKLKTAGVEFLTEAQFNDIQAAVQKESGANGKTLFQPLRVAVVGVPQGVELKKLAPLLPVKSLIARAELCLSAMN
ncbi:MAG: glutamate--tRNA ligase [Bdellovibrionales bacterium]